MKVKITKNAAKQLGTIMEQEADKDLKLRAYITHAHGDHAHYGLALDKPTEEDVVVSTDKEIDVIVKKTSHCSMASSSTTCSCHRKASSSPIRPKEIQATINRFSQQKSPLLLFSQRGFFLFTPAYTVLVRG